MSKAITEKKRTFGTKANVISISILFVIISILICVFIFFFLMPVGEPYILPDYLKEIFLSTPEEILLYEEMGGIIFFEDNISKISSLGTIGIIFLFFFPTFVGLISGILRAKSHVRRENKYIQKTNPYIYYRELPNDFGVGVTSLLFDSIIENRKDIVAVILDLCAKKYLKLEKVNDRYVVKVLKGIDAYLLANELYILSLIIDNNLKNLDYQIWFDYCVEDGKRLGLYYYETKRRTYYYNPDDNLKKVIKFNKILKILLTIGFGIAYFYIFKDKESLINNILKTAAATFGAFLALHIVLNIINIVVRFIEMGKQSSDLNYENEMNNKLTRTQKGVQELQKLYSFKAFMEDFGRFVDKNIEEVVLWDRYLSYAQVFGLTDQIMKSGYQQLVNNSSFIIDSIDDVNLENIDVQNKPEV